MECEIEELIVKFPPVINIPGRSSLYLGKKRILELHTRGGVVYLMTPYNYVKLTPDRWVKFIDYLETINEELKAIVFMTGQVSFCAHIGNEYYVTLNSPWRYVNISQYVFLLSCVRGLPTGDSVSLSLDDWTHLVALLPTIYEQHPELIT